MWRIAIIDDDRQVLQGMRCAIPWEELNAECVGEALTGADGLRMVMEVQPDIVITDIYMPVMNGIDMIERLRENEFRGKIIILSGYSDFEFARQALRFHVSDYVSKPISLQTLNSVLSKVIHELTEEEEQRMKQVDLAQKLSMYEPFVQKEWVQSAVAGTLSVNWNEAMLPPQFRDWHNKTHIVLGIEIVRDLRASEVLLTDWNLFRFAVNNIVSELAGEQFEGFEYTNLPSTRSALLLHLDTDEEYSDSLEKLSKLSTRIIESIRAHLKLTVRVGIGTIKSHWTDIPDSTEEAFRAMDLKEQRPNPIYDVFMYSSAVKGAKELARIRPVKFYSELAGAIKVSQEVRAYEIIAANLEVIERDMESTTPDYLQMLAGELWGIFAYCLYEVGMVLDDMFSNEQVVMEMAGITKTEHLAEWLKDKISIICTSREFKGNSKHQQVVDSMIQYIHEHYMEDINLIDFTSKVYISRNYLAIIFKNATGETFNNYLTRVRIEKAKELLLERNMLVYEVAKRVGYKNVPYFSNLFKKYTGMNPTDLVK
ncbi:response regulator transcription factor [Paenibacillus aceris]|uniref:Two-component system response regulator YesN n=1 Tax=Paenibacillus aceris TaxID=869555 RepID=A0ABS4I6W3_9BACL|nr:response regulator transcription factor [Paenibacillus aceris]MBP1966644.1 two-component system response regulator YesN [Paenibacillus aceris]NHW38880.1 response regulator transcription factor [Paenibacillus aceris]